MMPTPLAACDPLPSLPPCARPIRACAHLAAAQVLDRGSRRRSSFTRGGESRRGSREGSEDGSENQDPLASMDMLHVTVSVAAIVEAAAAASKRAEQVPAALLC